MAVITYRNTMDAALLAYFISKDTVYSYKEYRAQPDQPYKIHNISRLGYSYGMTVNRLLRNNPATMRELMNLPALEENYNDPSPTNSSLEISDNIIEIIGETLVLTITLNDINNNPILGVDEARLIFSGLGDAELSNFVDNEDGSYNFDVDNTTAETITISVVLDEITVGAFDPVSFVIPSLANSTLEISGTPLEAGTDTLTLTITVNDTNDDPIPGIAEARFIFSGKGASVFSNFVDNDDGTYSVDVDDATPEVITIALTINGVSLGSFPAVTFTAP